MKTLTFLLLLVGSLTVVAQTQEKPMQVEVACGQCQFGMTAKGCDLAVRIDGTPYFVDGTSIDDHGDAHAKDGFCQAIRKAEVTGSLQDGRFVVRTFRLLPKAE